MEDSERKATWWNCSKCSRKTKVIYTTQHNCLYNPKGWGLPLHNGQGCNRNTKNELSQIAMDPSMDPYRITHFSVSENRRFFLPVMV